MRKLSYAFTLATGMLLWNRILVAQITLPPSGDNQRCSVTQYMGLVEATITYHSPDVHAPDGHDRNGHIWGELVPYGFADLGFGYSNAANPSPWRAGANENTTVYFSHDVLIEGKPLKAGTYGFFIAPASGDSAWTLIFSTNSTSWGSFFYRPEEDALHVQVHPQHNDYHEWLTYEFTDRQLGSCTAQLVWENLKIPFHITVADPYGLYVNRIREQLQNATGFNYTAWVQAADFCAQHKINLDEAWTWAQYAMDENNGVGRRDFRSLSAASNVSNALGNTARADSLMQIAIADPSATMLDVHFYARGLQAAGRNAEALKVYMANYKKYPGDPVANLGMARGYSANGDYKNALKYAKAALALNPTGQVKSTLEDAVTKLEKNQDFN